MPIPNAVRPLRLLPLIAVGLATSLAFATAPSASAVPEKSAPAARERPALKPGDAYMGWRAAAASTSRVTTSAAKLRDMSGINGIDVSRWQGNVNWSFYKGQGTEFAYVKATEGTSYKNPYFGQQFGGAKNKGLFHGAYHFASPNGASGKKQASYFVAHGGAWKADGRTLPGVLDIEYNPYGSTCYGLSKKHMVSWVKSFTRQYHKLTGRDAVIYTTRDWWSRCTGNSHAFHTTNPLWVARYASKVGTLPGGWTFYTFWQYSSNPIDQDHFSSKRSQLEALAAG